MSTYEYGISGTAALDEGKTAKTFECTMEVSEIRKDYLPGCIPLWRITLTNKDEFEFTLFTLEPSDFPAKKRVRVTLSEVEE